MAGVDTDKALQKKAASRPKRKAQDDVEEGIEAPILKKKRTYLLTQCFIQIIGFLLQILL